MVVIVAPFLRKFIQEMHFSISQRLYNPMRLSKCTRSAAGDNYFNSILINVIIENKINKHPSTVMIINSNFSQQQVIDLITYLLNYVFFRLEYHQISLNKLICYYIYRKRIGNTFQNDDSVSCYSSIHDRECISVRLCHQYAIRLLGI